MGISGMLIKGNKDTSSKQCREFMPLRCYSWRGMPLIG